jgi:hypothetical protein
MNMQAAIASLYKKRNPKCSDEVWSDVGLAGDPLSGRTLKRRSSYQNLYLLPRKISLLERLSRCALIYFFFHKTVRNLGQLERMAVLSGDAIW